MIMPVRTKGGGHTIGNRFNDFFNQSDFFEIMLLEPSVDRLTPDSRFWGYSSTDQNGEGVCA